MVKSKIIGKLLKAQYLHQLILNSKKMSNNNAATTTTSDQFSVETPRGKTLLVPNDVKEGHFAVFSVNPEEERQRFVVNLHWLNHPSFLKLLKKAEDEYGFKQQGVLEFPCRAEELHKVLATGCSN
ncbi:auxin-responsive protein SAUR71-like [Solanum stenotomum]|uniref:auxin-responsive protein SAUR71-like n=1 Tax=Solanum stenotomum TaxID=172797 RepID=UPI0020D0404A|nr:auxin-responsive protein SAUR71-like [Solanum stenotomum]